jgi:thymidine phosphorylase
MQFQLKAKNLGIATEASLVILLNRRVAKANDMRPGDRVLLTTPMGRKAIATINAANDALKDDEVGLFYETSEALAVNDGEPLGLLAAPRTECIEIIKKKMEGKPLDEEEMLAIVKDIVDRELTDIELTYFVAACTMHPLSFDETVALAKVMLGTGNQLSFAKPGKIVIDKHCIGGVPGNRTTLLTVPMMASLGVIIPKTSSRAITSPAGTADTMEVFADVNLSVEKIQQVVGTVGACVVWGGSMNLAPADDRIIRIERPLSIDVSALMLASVMAIKASVAPTHLLIDIPYGPGAKVETYERAKQLRQQFLALAHKFNMKMHVVLTDGSQPIGNGVGPLLEAFDVMAVLKNDPAAPRDLREKAIHLAGQMLEFIGHSPHGAGRAAAEQTLANGKALAKFEEMIDAQGRKTLPPLGRFSHDVLAQRSGKILMIKNQSVTRIAHTAGAPATMNAGLLLYAKVGNEVSVGDKLFTIFADSDEKLSRAVQQSAIDEPFIIH